MSLEMVSGKKELLRWTMGDSRIASASEKGLYRHKTRRVLASSQGFTLIEIVLVIILLSVITVSVLPKFFDTTAISIAGAAAMVAADIRYTQELAMASNSPKTIVFTTSNTYYTVDSTNVNLPSHVRISSDVTFTFNSLGEPTAGGGSWVRLTAGGECKEIRVGNYTGNVSSASCP